MYTYSLKWCGPSAGTSWYRMHGNRWALGTLGVFDEGKDYDKPSKEYSTIIASTQWNDFQDFVNTLESKKCLTLGQIYDTFNKHSEKQIVTFLNN